MAVRLVFLGKLADLAGMGERTIEGPIDWQGLVDHLDGRLAGALMDEGVKVAVNGTLLADKRTLAATSGDEIALLPPVSGG